MANALYGKAKEAFISKLIDMVNDNIKVVAVDTAQYTVSLNVDQFLSDIPVGARIATSGNLSGKSVTLGVFNAANGSPLFSAVGNTSIEALVLYQDTAVAGTSRLICYIDTATGLPFQTNGGDVNVAWDTGANKIFAV